LKFFGRIKGYRGQELEQLIGYYLSALHLQSVKNVKVCKLNYAQKRKLSVANALIGNPELVFIDEATYGLDPRSKRHIWRTLKKEVECTQASVVLCTNSVSETEMICDKMGIIVNGTFSYFGDVHGLKKKDEDTINLTIYKDPETINKDELKSRIGQLFSEVNLISRTLDEDTYQIGSLRDVPYSQIFGTLEGIKRIPGVLDFVVYETSLRQIFLEVSKLQIPEAANTSCEMRGRLGTLVYSMIKN